MGTRLVSHQSHSVVKTFRETLVNAKTDLVMIARAVIGLLARSNRVRMVLATIVKIAAQRSHHPHPTAACQSRESIYESGSLL